MDWLLVGFFILLFEGEITSETSKSQLLTQENVPPILQRLLLSDVSNIQLLNGRRSYFGAAPQMEGTSDSKSQNAESRKGETSANGGSAEKQYSVDGSQSPTAGIKQQFEAYFQHGNRNGIHVADVNPRSADVNLGNSESSPAEKILSDNSSQTSLRPVNSDTTISPSTDKTNITDELWKITTTIAVGNSNLTENINTTYQTASNFVTDHFQYTTDVRLNNTTDSNTQTTDNVWTNITTSVPQTTTGNATSSTTISPTSDPCPDYPGLVAGLVVTAMVLAVLAIMLLSLYCKRIVLTCGSMCRCTKYTLV